MTSAIQVGELQRYQLSGLSGEENFIPYRDITRPSGVIRIEYYHSMFPTQPTAYSRFLSRMGNFHKEEFWKTLVLDDATFMELEARKWHQYVLNPTSKDGRQWYGGSKELLEEMLMMRFSGLTQNVVVLCHIDEDKDELWGEIVRNPAMPGKLSKRLGAAYGEQYRAYVLRDEKGNATRQLQTQNDGRYAVQSQIHAPNPCFLHYDSLWEGGATRKNIHVLVMGEIGTGKSTFAATFPKPMLVLFFDPYGKDEPYLAPYPDARIVEAAAA